MIMNKYYFSIESIKMEDFNEIKLLGGIYF
jgi:hypothetical protein